MTEHPLTDGLLQYIRGPLPRARVLDAQSMRTAYDLGRDAQLEQVNDFFDNYRKTVMKANPGYIPSLGELLSLMNHAMRPTNTQEGNQ